MQWEELKARLLEAGSARLSGEPAEDYIAKSTAGPVRGKRGDFFCHGQSPDQVCDQSIIFD